MAQLEGVIEGGAMINVEIIGTGPQGKQGVPGKDGYTPVKGIDYGTPEEIAEIAQSASDILQPDINRLKEEVARQLAAILPVFSAADNGKVLGIQNGKLAWVTVQASGGLTVNADGDTLTLDGDSVTANADGDTIVITTSLPVSTDGDTIILGGT